MLPIENPLAYFILMPLFALVALLIGKATGWDRLQPDEQAGRTYFRGINGLRGILATSVFFYHAVISYHFVQTGRWVAVDSNFYHQMGVFSVTMFFFITGFLFWTKLMKSPQGIPFFSFLRIRFRRLFPAYAFSFTMILIVLVVKHFAEFRHATAWLAVDIVRWLLFGVPGDFPLIGGFAESRLIDAFVVWSLRIEWAFYLALPFLGWFARKQRFLILPIVCLAAVHLHDPFNVADGAAIPQTVNFPLQLAAFFVNGFTVGIIAAYVKKHWRLQDRLQHWGYAVLAVALWFLTVFRITPHYGISENLVLGVIFFIVVSGNDLFGFLSGRAVNFLGNMSYSIYLMHGIVLYVCTQSLNRFLPLRTLSIFEYWCVMALVGAIVMAVSAFTYRFFEYPWLAHHKHTGAAE